MSLLTVLRPYGILGIKSLQKCVGKMPCPPYYIMRHIYIYIYIDLSICFIMRNNFKSILSLLYMYQAKLKKSRSTLHKQGLKSCLLWRKIKIKILFHTNISLVYVWKKLRCVCKHIVLGLGSFLFKKLSKLSWLNALTHTQ